MQKWEYKIHTVNVRQQPKNHRASRDDAPLISGFHTLWQANNPSAFEEMQQAGDDGWELVDVEFHWPDGVLFFKRPIIE